MPNAHPMMPGANHDELEEQLFVLELKNFVSAHLDPVERQLAEAVDTSPDDPLEDRAKQVRNRLKEYDTYKDWLALKRASQEVMWDAVRTSVERQADTLNKRANIKNPAGSVTLNPEFEVPKYLKAADTHMMPGGYGADLGEGNVLQGALMDRGGAIYMLMRNGGMNNDGRGQSALSHLLERFPDFTPERILDMGCGVGSSSVPFAQCFPEAEVHAIDVGASVLRYAHARAEHLDAKVNFSQQSAERTSFPDNSFDLVYSCALIHETSRTALQAIMDECYRLLRPGGVVLHLEVPLRYEDLDLFLHLVCDFETQYNNEPFWKGAVKADLAGMMEGSGFKNVESGFQDATEQAKRGTKGFTDKSKGVFRSWHVASGQK